jgi:hypothetical protein
VYFIVDDSSIANNTVGVTLLTSFSSLSPLVGSSSAGAATLLTSPLFLPQLALSQNNPDISKNIEISSDLNTHQ